MSCVIETTVFLCVHLVWFRELLAFELLAIFLIRVYPR